MRLTLRITIHLTVKRPSVSAPVREGLEAGAHLESADRAPAYDYERSDRIGFTNRG